MVRRNKRLKNHPIRYLITKLSPKSSISEQYRTVRTNIQFASVDQGIQTMLVTSAAPEEGKSMTVANLAVVYAQQGKKVLIIDADLRKPTVHYTFRLSNHRGLSNILVGETTLEAEVMPCDVENLEILTCGPIPPNPSELLTSKRMHALVDDARQVYDIVLFDAPPILAVTDAQILANLCDGTIVVMRSKQTGIDVAQKAIEALKAVNAKVLGTILNDSDKKEVNYY